MSRFQPATPQVGSARTLAEQHGAEIRDDFLTTYNQNDAARAWLLLADAIRSEASSVTTWSLSTTQWGAAPS